MEVKTLTNGFSLPVLGLGTAHIGGDTRAADHTRDQESIKSLRNAIELGVTHIDTAALYAAGHTEELVGEAIKPYRRNDLLISTKVWWENLHRSAVLASAEASLGRLDVDYIDLFCIHAPNPNVLLKETIGALDELVDRGWVKNIGVCNFSVALLTEAISLTKHKIVTNQIEYNLLVREKSHFHNLTHMESEIIPYCQTNDVLITAVCPLARGLVLETDPLMDELAKKYQKTYIQIALNWLISQPNVVTITKAEQRQHLVENIGATGWHLNPTDIERLRVEYKSAR